MNGWISRSPMEDLLVFADLLPASEGYRFKGLFVSQNKNEQKAEAHYQ